MHTITLQIPDAQLPFIISELNKFKDIKIEFSSDENTKEEIKAEIRQAVKEVQLIKQGKLKTRPARELLNEL
jgi:hypothetical protein